MEGSYQSKNFQEHLEHFVSEQKSCFQVVFNRLHINQYSIDWCIKYFPTFARACLSNSNEIPQYHAKNS